MERRRRILLLAALLPAMLAVRAAAGTRPEAEVAYTAGADGVWFTADDAVHHGFIATTNASGAVTSRSWMWPGKDGKAFTADDTRHSLEVFELAPDGRCLRSAYFEAPGPDGRWGTADDVAQWTELYVYADGTNLAKRVRRAGERVIRVIAYARDAAGRERQDVEYDSPGPDGVWDTADDGIEKYHRFEFDGNGRRVRSMEYHAQHEGRGPDGVWFTADDVVSATKTHLYDADGRLTKELKAVGKGADGAWFTADDVLQYYTLYLPANSADPGP